MTSLKAVHRWSTEHNEQEGQPLQPTLTSCNEFCGPRRTSACAIVQLDVSSKASASGEFHRARNRHTPCSATGRNRHCCSCNFMPVPASYWMRGLRTISDVRL